MTGTCFTKRECKDLGGTTTATCASKKGVCCVGKTNRIDFAIRIDRQKYNGLFYDSSKDVRRIYERERNVFLQQRFSQFVQRRREMHHNSDQMQLGYLSSELTVASTLRQAWVSNWFTMISVAFGLPRVDSGPTRRYRSLRERLPDHHRRIIASPQDMRGEHGTTRLRQLQREQPDYHIDRHEQRRRLEPKVEHQTIPNCVQLSDTRYAIIDTHTNAHKLSDNDLVFQPLVGV